MEPLCFLELIDDIQRLGLSYKLEKDIKSALGFVFSSENLEDVETQKSLHATALLFRILRQHGFDVPLGLISSIN